MVKIGSRGFLGGSVVVLTAALLAGCATQNRAQLNPTATATPSATPTTATSLTYDNTKYGFKFTLPLSWTGYTLVNTTWQGRNGATGKVVETGPLISIRHPLWTAANKRQDIPIMVFTISQWNQVISEKISLGAAPFPPSDIGRNAPYVFAIPARYNYAFPTGYQEVDHIIQSKPLHPY
jgi:hypothetical protein